MCRLEVTTRDKESGIKSITCTIYDATLKFDVWTTTEAPRKLPRAHTDHMPPDTPEGGPEELERRKRV